MTRAEGALRLALVLALACGGPLGAGRGDRLRGGQRPGGPASGLELAAPESRGRLSYRVAWAGDRLLAAELGRGFELVVRGPGPRVWRLPLGPSDWDVTGLAVAGERAYVVSTAGVALAIDLERHAIVARYPLGDAGTALAVSADGRWLATGTAGGVLCLRRLADDALLQCVDAHAARLAALAFRGDRLASAAWDGTVAEWSVPALAELARRRFPGSANALAISPDGATLAIARSGAPPRRSPAIERREAGPGTADPLAVVTLWHPGGGATMHLRGHRGAVTAVAWTGDGARIVSGSWDRTVRLWRPDGTELARLAGFAHLIDDLAVADDPRWIAAAAWGPTADAPATVRLALRYPAATN